MITAERVYEVFGITPGPWKLDQIEGYCIDNILDQCDGIICQSDVPLVAEYNNSYLIKASPEMLVTQINLVIGVNGLPPLTAIQGVLIDEWSQAIKAIESADSQNRKWPELIKALENTDE